MHDESVFNRLQITYIECIMVIYGCSAHKFLGKEINLISVKQSALCGKDTFLFIISSFNVSPSSYVTIKFDIRNHAMY